MEPIPACVRGAVIPSPSPQLHPAPLLLESLRCHLQPLSPGLLRREGSRVPECHPRECQRLFGHPARAWQRTRHQLGTKDVPFPRRCFPWQRGWCSVDSSNFLRKAHKYSCLCREGALGGRWMNGEGLGKAPVPGEELQLAFPGQRHTVLCPTQRCSPQPTIFGVFLCQQQSQHPAWHGTE